MNTNILSETAPPGVTSNEPRGFIPVVLGALFLAVRKYLKHKAPSKPELMSRADFLAQMLDIQQRINANHLAILDKLDANHRELLAVLERQVTRINALESGLARLDERTRPQPSTLTPHPS